MLTLPKGDRPDRGIGPALNSIHDQVDGAKDTPPRYSFAELLDVLGHVTGHRYEQVSVCWKLPGGHFTSELKNPEGATKFVDYLTQDGKQVHVWFGVNPLDSGLAKGRGNIMDVSRLVALYADLDVKPGGCPDLDAAHGLIDDVEVVLGQRPVAVIHSGHGLQPLWLIERESSEALSNAEAVKLLRRFGRLMADIADKRGCAVDSVFDLTRILRVPGTINCKDPEHPVPTWCEADTGKPLTAEEIRQALDDYGITEIASDKAFTGEVLSPPDGWEYAAQDCNYAQSMVVHWADDSDQPTVGRHQWAMSRAVRLAAAVRHGCLTENGLRASLEHLEKALAHWCNTVDIPRDLAPGEIDGAYSWAMQKVATFTEEQVGAELGDHKHDDDEREPAPEYGSIDGASLLDEVHAWFGRFVIFANADDQKLLSVWAAHTYLCEELYSTPRLLIDSITYGSGKTTLLEHLERLSYNALLATDMSSAALIPRLLDTGPRTILLDEIQRTLVQGKPDCNAVFAVINSGYRKGAKRPVLVPQGRDWVPKSLPTFAPIAMAGNSPHLPPDTVDRSIRILLMPDVDGLAEDSDWQKLDTEIKGLQLRLSRWADSVREHVDQVTGDLPTGCTGRLREKWRPLIKVAEAADNTGSGHIWRDAVYAMADNDLADQAAQSDAGLRQQTPNLVLLQDLARVWPLDAPFVSTADLIELLLEHNRDYWGPGINPGGLPRKQLNAVRLGRMIKSATNSVSRRPGGGGTPRGYEREQFKQAWRSLGIYPAFDGPTGVRDKAVESTGLTG